MSVMLRRIHQNVPTWLFVGWSSVLMSCGVVGPPIAPEDIGIEAKIRAQKQAEEEQGKRAEKSRVPIDQEEVPLPPLQPVGSQ